MPETPLKEVFAAIRAQMAVDRANDDIPGFNPADLVEAQAHVDYLNGLSNDARLPTFSVETTTTYKIKVTPPAP